MKRIVCGLVFAMTLLLNPVAFAQINAYCQIGGTDTLFIRDIARDNNLMNPTYIVFEVQRTFAKDQEYTLLRVTLEKHSREETPIKSVNIIVDQTKLLHIQEAVNVRQDNMPLGVKQKWYKISDKDLAAIKNSKSCNVIVEPLSGKMLNRKLGPGFTSDLAQMLLYTRENWRLANVRYYAQPTYQLFIPGVNAKKVADAIAYYANRDEKDKMVAYSGYYRVTSDEDRKIMLIQHDVDDTVYVEMQEDPNGCWINALWLYPRNGQSYNGPVGISELVSSNHKDFTLYKYTRAWWMLKFNRTYHTLAGKYNYGMGVRSEKVLTNPLSARNAQYSKGPFVIYSLNKELFPQLAEINLGDTIVTINGRDTKDMYLANFDKMTEYADDNQAITFIIKNAAGQEKKISITLLFDPNHEMVPDFVEKNKKNSFQFLRSTPEKRMPRIVFDSFAPYGDRSLTKKQW